MTRQDMDTVLDVLLAQDFAAQEDIGLEPSWPKACGCGCSYSASEWVALEYVGVMSDEVESLELRNCTCGSTVAQVIEAKS